MCTPSGICASSDSRRVVNILEKDTKIDLRKENKNEENEKVDKKEVCETVVPMYGMDNGSDAGASVFSASSSSVVVIEALEVVKHVDEKEKEKIY